jgi:amidase/aspartyl-tRNA(Asn)/glutamyl-tRNA(Gln) amidotransferase subunit A
MMATAQLPSTAALAQAIASGQTSAAEALDATLARIAATNDRVNAFTAVWPERAYREAQAVDRLRAQGLPLPPLAGVPYAVKNLFDVQGEVTLAGSVVLKNNGPASEDAFLVRQMQAAGAVLVGALNMDEFAYGFTTENSHYGPARNPHDLSRVAGGSSGGSAAAVAAAMVPLSLGSDTNGSIRLPAALCGVWGCKPSFGRLSRRGSFPFVHSIDHLGPFADSLHGLALAYDALQGPDAQDPGCHATAVQAVAQDLDLGVQGLRIGLLGGYFEQNASPTAYAAAQQAARVLGASAVVEWPLAAQGRAAAFLITASEGGSLHLDRLRTHARDYEPLTVHRLIAGATQPAAWYTQAQRFRRVYRDAIKALFADWDILLAPATPVSAPPIGTETLEIRGATLPCRPSLGLLTQPVSFMGCPVVAAPVWPDANAGLPLGVQVIAAPWREDLAFRAARVLERSGLAHTRAVEW